MGNPWAGGTLTANTDNLGGSGAISYQWRRNGENILNANSNFYTLQPSDVGSIITVIVTRANYSGSIESLPIAVIPSPPLDRVIRVDFGTSNIATVTLSSLTSSNIIYLAKINTSNQQVAANQTGRVLNATPDINAMITYGSYEIPGANRPLMDRPSNIDDYIHFSQRNLSFDNIIDAPVLNFIPPVVGDTRNFFVESVIGNENFISRQATLRATGTHGTSTGYVR
jgi:hypothetical protein